MHEIGAEENLHSGLDGRNRRRYVAAAVSPCDRSQPTIVLCRYADEIR